jgi:hypothetical protein
VAPTTQIPWLTWQLLCIRKSLENPLNHDNTRQNKNTHIDNGDNVK